MGFWKDAGWHDSDNPDGCDANMGSKHKVTGEYPAETNLSRRDNNEGGSHPIRNGVGPENMSISDLSLDLDSTDRRCPL